MLPGWRAAAAQYGRILVMTGPVDLMPDGEQTSPSHVIDVIRRSHGALVLLTADSAPAGLPTQKQPESPGGVVEQAEYSELLTAKLRSQESFEVLYTAETGRQARRPGHRAQMADQPLASRLPDLRRAPRHQSRPLRRPARRDHGDAQPAPLHLPGLRHYSTRHRMVRPTASFAVGYLHAAPDQPSIRDFPVTIRDPSAHSCSSSAAPPEDGATRPWMSSSRSASAHPTETSPRTSSGSALPWTATN